MTFLRRPIGWIIPIAIFLAIAGATLFTSAVTTRASERSLDAHTQLFADQLAARLQTCVEARVEMVVAMRREWDAGGLRDPVSFAQRATSLIASFPGYQAINRLDAQGVVVDVHPEESNREVVGKNLSEHPPTRDSLAQAARTNTPQLTGPIDLIQGGRGFGFYIPLRDPAGNLAGYFNGAFRNDVLVRSCLAGAEIPEHTLTVWDDDQRVFGLADADGATSHARHQAFPLRNRTWRVQLVPTPRAVQERLAPGRVLLGSGLAFALLVAGITGVYLSYRLRATEAMRQSREEIRRLAKLVDASRDFIGVGDLDGHLLYLNRSAREMLGHEDMVPAGTFRPADLVAAEDVEATQRHFRAAAEQGFARAELRVRHRQTGNLTPLEFQTFVVDARPGAKPLLGTVGRDLRERQKLEHDLQQAQKMEALGRLAGGVAHDFNNLLTVILNGAQFAVETQSTEMRAKILRDVVDAAQRAAGLTRQLMALGRGRNSGVGPVDLGAVVNQMRPLFQRLLRADIQLELRTPEQPAMLHGNRVQLEQIIVNLLMNASDAMPHGGKLEVEVTAKGDEVLLSVSDTGVGMSPEVAGRIFEPFFTTKAPGAGTGLGLATVYAHVQRLNGRIDVHSSPGHGSRFVLHFPASTPATLARGETTPSTVVRTAERAPGLRVLLAEDDNLVRSAITRSLRAAGIETVEADNGEAAIRLLSEGGTGRVDVVLSDVVMPKMGGAGLLHWVRGHRPELPVVLISGHTGDELAGIDVQAQGVRVIEKPFDPAKLVQLLRECAAPKA